MNDRKSVKDHDDDDIEFLKSVSSIPICSQGETDTDVLMQHQRHRLCFWQRVRLEKSRTGLVKTQQIKNSHPPTAIQTSADSKCTHRMSLPLNPSDAIQT